jgi:hypothetical protein
MLRHIVGLLTAVPGILLAVAAKPFLLGDWALWLGIVLAFLFPIYWYASEPFLRSRH